MPDEHDPELETTRQTPVGEDPEVVAGRYRILRTLGRGGGGIVWLARDEHLGREVALKRVSGEADLEVLLTRGMREARTSAALAHGNVVTVYDAFEHDDAPWIVMEYVPGPSLASMLQGGQTLPPRQVARIGAQVARALAQAHGAGIIHRDVKPGNVLLTDDSGRDAKLTDFGIARAEDDHQLTRTGLVSGTAAYFSPEMARGEEPSAASDVWALGATLYAAVEGRRPFPEAPNAVAQLHAIARDEPSPPARAGALTPILQGMLDPDPRTRWTADDAARAMAQVAEGRVLPGPQVAHTAAAAAYDDDATQAVHAVDSTRHVPVARREPARQEALREPPRHEAATGHARAGYGATDPHPSRRRGPNRNVVLGWLLGVPLVLVLAWLVWTIATSGDEDSAATPPAPDDTVATSAPPQEEELEQGPVDPAVAGDLARTFYETLVRQGLEAARPMLGPDVAIASDIDEDLTYIEWPEVRPEATDDGDVRVAVTVIYHYGSTEYEQQETLLVGRPEGGGDPVILERSTSDATVTTRGDNDDDDEDNGEENRGKDGRGNRGRGGKD